MVETQKITRLILCRLPPFHFCEIDLTDSQTGDPFSEVCFIGPNGTGKSIVLSQLYESIDPSFSPCVLDAEATSDALVITKYRVGEQRIYQARTPAKRPDDSETTQWFSEDVENSEHWSHLEESPPSFDEFCEQFADYLVNSDETFVPPQTPRSWFSPDLALVNAEPANDLRGFLEEIIKHRDTEFYRFLRLPGNRSHTIAEVESDFEHSFPNTLGGLAKLWDHVLAHASLRFDPSGEATLRSLRDNNAIPFSALSRGMRQNLLRLGQVFAQYFETNEKRGFVFLDEPENGLHPEIAFQLVDMYRSILAGQKAQLFVGSHSPFVATQFEPSRRIRFCFNDDGTVSADSGIAPKGSDPNLILTRDFELREMRPAETQVKIGRYSKIHATIHNGEEQDEKDLANLIDEAVSMRKL